MNGWLFLIPLISALIGWLIHTISIRLLFRPKLPLQILGFQFQGFIPKRKIFFAKKLGVAASSFVSLDEIEKKISDPENLKNILPTIEEHIEHFLRVKLKQSMPMIGMLIGDRTINQLKQLFVTELETLFPLIMRQYTESLRKDVNLEEIVAQKINSISDERIESIIYQNMPGEILKLKLYGAVWGFIIGLVQLGFVYLVIK